MEEPSVRLGHMECFVEGGVDEHESADDDSQGHNITFLYTLADGACPKSFGINVAKLAGLPDEVLSKAKQKSVAFEREMLAGQAEDRGSKNGSSGLAAQIKSLLQNDDMDALQKLWESNQSHE